LALNGLYSYTASYKFDPVGLEHQAAYGLLNGSIIYTSLGEKLKISVWGNNLTDKNYFNFNAVNSFGIYANYAQPRTYGLTVAYKFL
jgi:iron complex outermembrane receptor protein